MLNESFPLFSGRTGPPDTKNEEGRLGMWVWEHSACHAMQRPELSFSETTSAHVGVQS